MRLGRSSQVQRAPQTRVVAPPAGSPPTTPATATAGVKALPDPHSPPDSPARVRQKTEGTPQPLGSTSRVDTLARDAFLEEKDSSQSTEGLKPRLGSRSYPTSPRHSPADKDTPTVHPGAPGSEEEGPYGPPVHTLPQATTGPIEQAPTAVQAQSAVQAHSALQAPDPVSDHPVQLTSSSRSSTGSLLATPPPVSDSSSIGALESGTTVTQALRSSTEALASSAASGSHDGRHPSSLHARASAASKPPPEAALGHAEAEEIFNLPNTPDHPDVEKSAVQAPKTTPAAKMKAALSANLLKVAAFAGLAAASSTGQPTLSADPRRGLSVEVLPVSDSGSDGALESGTSVSQAGGTPMQFLGAAEGCASQSGSEHLSLGGVALLGRQHTVRRRDLHRRQTLQLSPGCSTNGTGWWHAYAVHWGCRRQCIPARLGPSFPGGDGSSHVGFQQVSR